ncbi:MAG: SixA phosphatase family protein [Nocardioides sp.]
MKTLVIMRHAKAEASAPTDFERRLTERGHRDAADAGQWLASVGVAPDYALVSSAARTTQTWESAAEAAGWDVDLAEFDEDLYAANTDAALGLINRLDDGFETVVVVGHNPTMATLTQLVDDTDGVELGDFATSAVAVFTVEGDWAELTAESGTATGFHIGRG